MNTFVLAGFLVAVLFAVEITVSFYCSARLVEIARVGLKTFYMIEGKGDTWWTEALQASGEEGRQMAVVENEGESHALSAYLRKQPENGLSGLVWLGAYLKRGKWRWAATGEELTYTNWDEHAVLNNPGDSPTNGYGCGYISGGFKWGTWACGSEKAMVVCQ